jgi:curved DNA-binding protein CbpA
MADHYGALGVAKTATTAEIKKAYRAKARALHPDVNPGKNTEAEFKAVNHAHDILSDPAARSAYDSGANPNLGRQWSRPKSSTDFGGRKFRPRTEKPRQSPADDDWTKVFHDVRNEQDNIEKKRAADRKKMGY